MDLNRLNKRQEAAYDRACGQIRRKLGSYNNMSMAIFSVTDVVVTGETLRLWMMQRKIPTDYCFMLYEAMERDFDIFALVPWMADFFEVKEKS